ncbi:MAG: hypothetical protein R8M45_11395, partial [Ghiorsea sp.]
EVSMILDDAKQLGRTIVKSDRATLDRNYQNWEAATGLAIRTWYSQALGSVTLYPTPDLAAEANLITFRAAIKPTRAALSLDDSYAIEHQEAIVAGAKYILMSQMGRPWSEPSYAMMNKDILHDAIVRSRIFSNAGGSVIRVDSLRFS